MADDEIAELSEIRRKLRRYREYVDDKDLRKEIQEWLNESHKRVEADSVAEFVSARLTSLLSDHDMFHSAEANSPGAAFPEACADCRHYGSACPVLVGPTEPDFRERKLAEATTEAEERQVFERQATDTGCIRIPEFLDQWDDEYADFVHEGDELLHRVEETFLDGSEFDVDTDAEVDV
jgi:hypothetical protein